MANGTCEICDGPARHGFLTNVHYCDHADQPYVRLKCTGEDHYVWQRYEWELREKVYSCDKNDGPGHLFYTFEPEKVTCAECKELVS